MPISNSSILSIIPYRVLPATTGGHLSIVDLHNYIGRHCQDHLAGTTDNGDEGRYAFKLHRVFPPSVRRYIPLYNYTKLKGLAKAYDVKHIYCDHPYMAITAIALSRALHIPWYMRSHNIESERFRTLGKWWWPIMHRFERYTMRKSNGVFFITPEDKAWAEKHYKLPVGKAHFIPYGTNLSAPPADSTAIKQAQANVTGIPADIPWLYFLGTFNYQPNIDAVVYLLDEMIPRLDKAGKKYHLFIAGKGLDEKIVSRIKETPNVSYTGFVDDLDIFIRACDIMVNPVMTGGGIKTKAVEALGYNKTVVSSAAGAAGLMKEVCGSNLLVTADYDWDAFAEKVITATQQKPAIPQRFYDTYYWDNAARKILSIMNGKLTAPLR